MPELQEKLLAKIKEGEIAMRPRWYFVLITILGLSGVVLLFLGTIYLLSFIGFVLRESGILFAPFMGFHGIIFMVFASPWLIIFFVLLFLVSLEILVRRYSFAYRSPLLYSVIAILVLAILSTILLVQSPMHQRIHSFVRDGEVPLVGKMYDRYAHRPPGMYVGTVSKVFEGEFLLKLEDGSVRTILYDNKTKLEPELTLTEGVEVMLIGKESEETVYAKGIRKFDRISPDRVPPPPNDQFPRQYGNPWVNTNDKNMSTGTDMMNIE